MALKDLVSDLSNFNGRSQYDKLDSQIEKGVDFFPNTDAPGFTPKTDLETLYHKVKEGTVAPIGGDVTPYANLNPIEGRKSTFSDNDERLRFMMRGTIPPGKEQIAIYNGFGPRKINMTTLYGIGDFTIDNQPAGLTISNPRHPNANGNSLLPAPNLFPFQDFRERSRTSETPPFHSTVDAPFTNVTLPNIFSPDGYDGNINTRDRYKDGSIHIFSDDNKEPIGGRVSMFADLLRLSSTSQFSDPNLRGSNNKPTKPEGFSGHQTTLFLPKEIFRTVAGKSLVDTFNNTESSGLNITTLKKEYSQNKSIEDLFQFKSGTFKNVPSGINDKGNFGTKSYKEVADPFNFDLYRQPFMLRETGNQWGLDGTSATNPLGAIAGAFVRGAPGITGLIDRNITDKFRIGKFLLTSTGFGFIAKQFALQFLNPTLESKWFNPLSIFGVVGAQDAYESLRDAIGFTGGGIMTNLSQLAEGASDFAATIAFPIGHPERHVGGLRYEKVNPMTNLKPKSELGKKIKAIPLIGNAAFNAINKKIDDVGGFSRLAAQAPLSIAGIDMPLKNRMLLINPNKYLSIVSSAPKLVSSHGVQFIGSRDDAGGDANQIESKVGGTFNEDTATSFKSEEGLTKRHTTMGYDNLKSDNAYYKAGNIENFFFNSEPNTLNQKTGDLKTALNLGNQAEITEVTKTDPVLGVMRGSALSSNVDKVNMIPYGSETKLINEKEVEGILPNKTENDFIKFRFFDMVNKKWIIFRAILDGISDAITPEYGEEKYIGRPDKVYIYSGADRTISFNFKIYPKTKQELPVLMEKLNYLVGLCYPSYTSEERMISPFMSLTIGNLFDGVTGLLYGLTVTVEDTGTWEIDEGLQFPHYISCACEFKYIGDNILATKGKHYGLDWIPEARDDLGFDTWPTRKIGMEKAIFSELKQSNPTA